jgi:phosphate starvation-inducible membrane PsiE
VRAAIFGLAGIAMLVDHQDAAGIFLVAFVMLLFVRDWP